ncbi:MAG TPA: ATP-binding protein [Acidimicrobiia bacterium]|nr:ATP-binding protein [Acidimicrobiia bacterium]
MAAPRRRSLATRLLVAYALAVLAVVGVLGFFVERSAREALVDEVQYGLAEQARAAAFSLPETPGEIVGFVEGLAPITDARVTVIDSDGSVLADSHADAETMENHSGRPEVQAASRGDTGFDRRVSVSTGFNQLYAAVQGPGDRVVRLSLPENVVNAPIREFRGRLLLMLAVAGLAGVAAVALVARRLTRPLAELSEVASSVAAGDLDVEPPRSSVAELDDLGRSLGSMSTELGHRLEEVSGERRTLEVVLDALPQGTLLVDTDDGVLYANRSLIDLLGPVPESLAQVVPFRIQEMVRRARDERTVVDIDLEHGRPARVLRVIVSPFDDGRALVVVSDITDRRRVDDVRRDFVTNASHELKTPVSSILAAAETLQVALERAPDKVPQFAAQIEVAARSLARLVSDLLDLSRLEGRTAQHVEMDLERVVVAEVERMRPLAEERKIGVVSDTVPVSVMGSPEDLALAVRNLLDNAVRYSDPGAVVTIRLDRQGDEAVVSVTDSGTGIPQRDLERIFERFYRVDVARSRATGGTGLGLSIVRHVVESHGGKVTVESQLGSGSTFTTRLPLD